MNSSPKRASSPGPAPDASGYCTQDLGNISDPVTIEDLEVLDASSLGSMSIGPGGNKHPAEIRVQTNNLIEVSTGSVERKCTPEKLFKYLIFMGCLLFLLVTVIILGLKHSGETETLKQCSAGYYNFPECLKCECASDGSTMDCYDTGDCICKDGFDGSKCDKCKEGFTGNKCDECKPNITGHDCNQCKLNYFNYPLCQECVCNSVGSTSLDCDENYGNCSCKEGFTGIKCHKCMLNVIGDKCDTCLPGFFGYPFCLEEEKILIATGYPSDDGINSEIVDVEDSNFSCTNIEQFPAKLAGASGGLMYGQTPFICGGYGFIKDDWTFSNDCYQLTEAGSWAKDQRATLTTPRAYAGYSSVVLDNNLVLTGGINWGYDRLTSIEMMSPNTTAKTISVHLPTGFRGHCPVPWDYGTFLVIGGYGNAYRDESYFINVKTNQRTNGPSLNTPRSAHACAELQLNGNTYIVVTGGLSDGVGYVRSTEVLDKSNVGHGWRIVNDLDFPVVNFAFQMVSSPDKKALYAIGGDDGTKTYYNAIFKFQCTGDINTCRWTKSETTLRFGRDNFVAIPIPYSLADKLCSTVQTTVKPTDPTTAEPTDPTDQCDYYNDLGYVGDGLCDDGANSAECGYDGGDCCGDDVNTYWCDECICHQT